VDISNVDAQGSQKIPVSLLNSVIMNIYISNHITHINILKVPYIRYLDNKEVSSIEHNEDEIFGLGV